MFKVLLVIIVILAVFLCFIVTIQNSKGGGLAAGFASSNQIMGVRKTTETIEKITWGLAIALVVLSLFATISIPRHSNESVIETQVDPNATNVNAVPAATVPATAPVEAPAPEAE